MEEDVQDVAKEDENSTSMFLMYGYKVIACSKRYRHDWSVCPFAHQGEMAARRDPRTYLPMFCYYSKQRIPCPRGDACQHAHNLFEYWLHPARYRTQLCQFGTSCSRPVCFFAHGKHQVRNTGMPGGTTPVVAPPEPLGINPAGFGAMHGAGRSLAPDILGAEQLMVSAGAGSSSMDAAMLQHHQQQQLLQMQAQRMSNALAAQQQTQQSYHYSDSLLPSLDGVPVSAADSWGMSSSSGPLPPLMHAHSMPPLPTHQQGMQSTQQQVLATMQQLAAAMQQQEQSPPHPQQQQQHVVAQRMHAQQLQQRTPMTAELVFDNTPLVRSSTTGAVNTGALLEQLLSRQLSTGALSAPVLPQVALPPGAPCAAAAEDGSSTLPSMSACSGLIARGSDQASAAFTAAMAAEAAASARPRVGPAADASSHSQAPRAVTPDDARVDAPSRVHTWSAPVSPTNDRAAASAAAGQGHPGSPSALLSQMSLSGADAGAAAAGFRSASPVLVVGGEALSAAELRRQLDSPHSPHLPGSQASPPAPVPPASGAASEQPIGAELAAQLLASLPQSSVVQLLHLVAQQQRTAQE